MHPLPTLKITEIFPSIQGEGLRQGTPAIFIRLSGCNLQCSFCDTRYAWTGGREKTMQEIVDKVRHIHTDYPAEWICLTGGEPLVQDITSLILSLKRLGFFIQVETNATLSCNLPVDWYTVSPKPDAYAFRPEYKKKAHEIKIVVTKDLNYPVIRRLRNAFPDSIPIWLQPQSILKWSTKKALRLVREALEDGQANIRLGVQLQRLYGIK